MQKDCIALLIDPVSKAQLHTSVAALQSDELEIINSLSELGDGGGEQERMVVLLEGVLSDSTILVDLRLFKAVMKLDYVILCSSADNYLTNTGLARAYVCDFRIVTAQLLQAAVLEDTSMEDYEVQNAARTEILRYVKDVLAGNVESPKEVVGLAREFHAMYVADSAYGSTINALKEEQSRLLQLNAKLQGRNEKLTQGYAELLQKVGEQNRVLQRYEVALSKELYRKINTQSYPNRPLIIYFKEFEAVEGADEFYHTVCNMVRLQLKRTVKLLKLYDNANCRPIRHLPPEYKILRNHYSTADLAINDYLVKTGTYEGVIDNLLTNQSSPEVLIIVDCKGADDIVLTGQILQLNVCGDRSHLEAYGLKPSNTIVTGDTSDTAYHCWQPTAEALEDPGDTFVVNASTKVMQHLARLIGDYVNKVGGES